MSKFDNTYCNPIPLPDYPIGRDGINRGDEYNWRETADPTVLYEDGKWYLYSSCGMVYWTEDFKTWNHERMDPYDCGYAPTVVKHKGKYLLASSLSDVFVSDSLMGPFKSAGEFILPNGDKLLRCYDPMIFSDDDDRLFLYYSTGEPIILGAELDSDNPRQLLQNPEILIRFNNEHTWERKGEYNADGRCSSIEGPWLHKAGDTYYLIYTGPGTEYSSYAMGAYKGPGPMGPWTYMETSPFTLKRDGLVRGPGHGSIVEGPNNTLWVFYTTTICFMDPMERRIGFDPIYINENGDLVCKNITETPQWAPGVVADPVNDNDTGLICLSGRERCFASSHAPGREAIYATDENLMSFWQPADDDKNPQLTIPLQPLGVNVAAVRIMWRDVDLSLQHGNLPGPIKYKVEICDTYKEEEGWTTILDCSDNETDLIVDYRVFETARGNRVRLTILDWPEGIKPGVMNMSVFGWWSAE